MRHPIVLRLTAVGFFVVVLAGCSGDQPQSGDPPDPVSLASPEKCHVCGMVIEKHHGPNGQMFYRSEGAEETPGPVQFDSLKQGLFPNYFENKKRGKKPWIIYVTDYSTFDYTIETVKGDPYIQSAVKPGTFSPARDVVFVAGSDVRGAMGKDFIPFSDQKDAREFAETYGGDLLTFKDITLDHTRR